MRVGRLGRKSHLRPGRLVIVAVAETAHARPAPSYIQPATSVTGGMPLGNVCVIGVQLHHPVRRNTLVHSEEPALLTELLFNSGSSDISMRYVMKQKMRKSVRRNLVVSGTQTSLRSVS